MTAEMRSNSFGFLRRTGEYGGSKKSMLLGQNPCLKTPQASGAGLSTGAVTQQYPQTPGGLAPLVGLVFSAIEWAQTW